MTAIDFFFIAVGIAVLWWSGLLPLLVLTVFGLLCAAAAVLLSLIIWPIDRLNRARSRRRINRSRVARGLDPLPKKRRR